MLAVEAPRAESRTDLAPCPFPRKDPVSCNPSKGSFHTRCARDCGRTCRIRRVRIPTQVGSLAQPHRGWWGNVGRGTSCSCTSQEAPKWLPKVFCPPSSNTPSAGQIWKSGGIKPGLPQDQGVLFPWQFFFFFFLFRFSFFFSIYFSSWRSCSTEGQGGHLCTPGEPCLGGAD